MRADLPTVSTHDFHHKASLMTTKRRKQCCKWRQIIFRKTGMTTNEPTRILAKICHARNCQINAHRRRLSPGRRRCDVVDGFYDTVQGRVGSDRHVGAAEVVVDGANHANDVQVSALLRLEVLDTSWMVQPIERPHQFRYVSLQFHNCTIIELAENNLNALYIFVGPPKKHVYL